MTIPVRVMIGAAVVSCAGIVIAASGSNDAGGAITVAGWLAFVFAIHRYGRSGNANAKTENA
jgi:hypothetical protein